MASQALRGPCVQVGTLQHMAPEVVAGGTLETSLIYRSGDLAQALKEVT